MNILKYIFITLICFFNFLSRPLSGQNLLPNPSFEDTSAWPLPMPVHWQAATVEGWNYYTPLNNVKNPDWGAPNNVFGYQKARSGKAYLGMALMHLFSFTPSKRNIAREYLQTKLKRPLKADSTYCFQIYVSLADSMLYASRGLLGVYFSKTAVHGNHRQWLPYTPQIVLSPHQYLTDKVNWVKYSGTYKAMGGEEYLTMGNFNDTTTIDTIFVGGGNEFYHAQIYYYLDDIFLGSCDSLPDSLSTAVQKRKLEHNFSVYPNPFVNEFVVESSSLKKLYFNLYNSMGQKVALKVNQQGNHYRMNTANLPKGLYWLKINDGKVEESVKLVKE